MPDGDRRYHDLREQVEGLLTEDRIRRAHDVEVEPA